MTATTSQKPTPGRIVFYRLTETDLAQIRADRAGSPSTHRGNFPSVEEAVPLLIVKVWPDEFGPDIPGINGQAFLDGTHSIWVTSAREGTEAGNWSWPSRV